MNIHRHKYFEKPTVNLEADLKQKLRGFESTRNSCDYLPHSKRENFSFTQRNFVTKSVNIFTPSF